MLLRIGFRLYAANASGYGAYGMMGAVLLFVTWLYFASIVVLLDGAVNAVRREARSEGGEFRERAVGEPVDDARTALWIRSVGRGGRWDPRRASTTRPSRDDTPRTHALS